MKLINKILIILSLSIVHAYSAFEKKVAASIRDQAEVKGLSGNIEEVLVPTEEVVEMRRGKKVNTDRKFFPGYVLAKIEMTDETYHLVKHRMMVITNILIQRGIKLNA